MHVAFHLHKEQENNCFLDMLGSGNELLKGHKYPVPLWFHVLSPQSMPQSIFQPRKGNTGCFEEYYFGKKKKKKNREITLKLGGNSSPRTPISF